MTSTSPSKASSFIALKPWQIKSIIYNMGWDPEDAETFLKMAVREMLDPGVHNREEAAYFRALIERDDAQLAE